MTKSRFSVLAGGIALGLTLSAGIANAQGYTTTQASTSSNVTVSVATSTVSTAMYANLVNRLMFLESGDLSLGSRGDAVSSLQSFLQEQGFLQIPAGVPLGYYGNLTKTAVAAYQKSLGVSSTGYFGPLTREATMRMLSRITGVMTSNPQTGTSGSNGSGSSQTTGTSQSSNSSGQGTPGSGLGYWYNNTWHSVGTSTTGGGYYSTNPNPSGSSSNSSGYWYNNSWYQTGTSGTTTSMNSSGGGTPTPTGYWYNGSWYSSLPTTTATTINQGIPGYWSGNTWFSVDGRTTVSYNEPTPGLFPAGVTDYWYNGVWHPVTPDMTTASTSASSTGSSSGA